MKVSNVLLALLMAASVVDVAQAQNQVASGSDSVQFRMDRPLPPGMETRGSWCDDSDGLECGHTDCEESEIYSMSICWVDSWNTSYDPDLP